MKLEISIAVVYIDGVEELLKIQPPEWVKWERAHSKSIQAFEKDASISDLLFLAYAAKKRTNTGTGNTIPTYEVWEDTIASIDIKTGDEKKV